MRDDGSRAIRQHVPPPPPFYYNVPGLVITRSNEGMILITVSSYANKKKQHHIRIHEGGA